MEDICLKLNDFARKNVFIERSFVRKKLFIA